jgi:hypothetical protein
MEMKRIGQFEVDSGRVLIVDAAYVAEPKEGAIWAAVSAKGDGDSFQRDVICLRGLVAGPSARRADEN